MDRVIREKRTEKIVHGNAEFSIKDLVMNFLIGAVNKDKPYKLDSVSSDKLR